VAVTATAEAQTYHGIEEDWTGTELMFIVAMSRVPSEMQRFRSLHRGSHNWYEPAVRPRLQKRAAIIATTAAAHDNDTQILC